MAPRRWWTMSSDFVSLFPSPTLSPRPPPSSSPPITFRAQHRLRLDLLGGFLNEMDVLAPRRHITQAGCLLSSSPVPPSLLFIRRLPMLQHGGVQLPSLSDSLESPSLQGSPSEPPSSIQASFEALKYSCAFKRMFS